MSLNYSFAGKRILVTGGGQGIGRQLVQRFHDGGAVVCTLDKNGESIATLKKELPGVMAEVADLMDWETTKKVVESFGVIDHLVNNAGIMIPAKFMDITEGCANLHFGVNVSGAIAVTQAVAKGMIERGSGGSVVNIASLAARINSPSAGLYCATKAALENVTKSMALELGPHNIRVNSILPGMVNAPMLQQNVDIVPEHAKMIEAMMERLVVKRTIEPNEIADLVLFLLSPLSSMITGQGIVIDGGYLLF